MDVVIQVFINAPTHTLPAEKAARRYANGDIFNVSSTEGIGGRSGNIYTPIDEIGMTRMGFVFVIDGPVISIENANTVLFEDSVNSQPGATVETAVKRNWVIDLGGLTIDQRSELSSQKYTTITFLEFNSICRDKLDETKTLADMGVI